MTDRIKKAKGLLITYYFTPLNVIATHRVASFAKYLNTSDFELDVLCPKWEGELEEPSSVNILYTSTKKFDKNFGKIKVAGLRKLRSFLFHKFLKLHFFNGRKPGHFYYEGVQKLNALDIKQYDFVITSYAPLDTIHLGRFLKEKYPHLKWIIDYRDLYSLMEYHDMGITRSFFKNFEKKLTSQADAFITVSEVLLQQQKEIINKPCKVIYNGFEDYSIESDEKFESQLSAIQLPIISYAGALYEGERDVKPFLKFIKSKKIDTQFTFIFALINDFDKTYLQELVSTFDIKNVIIKMDLKFNQSLILQRRSAFLLLLSNFNGRGNGYLTGKVFEYIASGKPIIYSGTTDPDYELYKLIRMYELGEQFEKIDYHHPDVYKMKDTSFFHRKNQANVLKDFLKDIIGFK